MHATVLAPSKARRGLVSSHQGSNANGTTFRPFAECFTPSLFKEDDIM
jgi:hypothetical protein